MLMNDLLAFHKEDNSILNILAHDVSKSFVISELFIFLGQSIKEKR